MKLMLEKGADPNLAGRGGTTPLDCATLQKRPDIAELLRRHGARQ